MSFPAGRIWVAFPQVFCSPPEAPNCQMMQDREDTGQIYSYDSPYILFNAVCLGLYNSCCCTGSLSFAGLRPGCWSGARLENAECCRRASACWCWEGGGLSHRFCSFFFKVIFVLYRFYVCLWSHGDTATQNKNLHDSRGAPPSLGPPNGGPHWCSDVPRHRDHVGEISSSDDKFHFPFFC